MKLKQATELKQVKSRTTTSDMPKGYTEDTRYIFEQRKAAMDAVWPQAMEAVRLFALPEKDEEFKSRFTKTIAENILVKEGVCPPEWTGVIDCERCGTVPYFAWAKGDAVVGCPWCHSPVYQAERENYLVAKAELALDEVAGVKEFRHAQIKSDIRKLKEAA